MLALIHDDSIISIARPGGWFELPDGSRVSPAQDGWTDGTYRLSTIQPADATPEGKQVVSTSVELVDGHPRYVHVLEDVPPVDLIAYAANRRWQVETGGITLGGSLIDTSRESQAMITGAYNYSQVRADKLIKFKAASGWAELDAATVAAIATAVGDHVQACFDAESVVVAAITAGTVTTVEQVDAFFSTISS